MVCAPLNFRKILAPIKIKSALPPNPKYHPPLTRNFTDIGFSCRKNAFFQAPMKLAQPFPAPESRHEFYGREDFSENCAMWQSISQWAAKVVALKVTLLSGRCCTQLYHRTELARGRVLTLASQNAAFLRRLPLRSVPLPSNPCIFGKKQGKPRKKNKGFSLCGTAKILGKERKNAQKKQGKSENENARKSKKSKGWRVKVCICVPRRGRRRSKTRVLLGRRVPNGKPQKRLRLRDLRGKNATAFRKTQCEYFLRVTRDTTTLNPKAGVGVPDANP